MDARSASSSWVCLAIRADCPSTVCFNCCSSINRGATGVAAAAFGYHWVFPGALKVLIGDFGKNFHAMLTIEDYTNFFLAVILGLGVTFELPVLIFFLALFGIVDGKFLIKHNMLVYPCPPYTYWADGRSDLTSGNWNWNGREQSWPGCKRRRPSSATT